MAICHHTLFTIADLFYKRYYKEYKRIASKQCRIRGLFHIQNIAYYILCLYTAHINYRDFRNEKVNEDDDDVVMISGLVSSSKCNRDKSEVQVNRYSREGNKQTYNKLYHISIIYRFVLIDD